MMTNEIFSIEPKTPFTKELVTMTFDFSIDSVPETLVNDDSFIYDDEVFMVNFGEEGKFTSDYIFQSRFVVLKNEDGLNFNGYAPDFARKSNIMLDNTGSKKFEIGKTYSVKIQATKYRVYIDIDNGFAKTSYGNGRNVITDAKFYVRNGVKATLNNVTFTESDLPELPIDNNLKMFIDKGIVTNYLFWHNAFDGVYFDRINIEQNLKATTRNSGAYQSNIMFDMYTNSKTIGIEYEVTDIPCEEWQTEFGFIVNGKRLAPTSRITKRDTVYTETFTVPFDAPEYNRITICFPFSVSVAVRKVTFDKGAKFSKAKKNGWIYFFGDSITEGSECFDPSAVYVSQVCMAYNYNGLDQAISGRTFSDYNILGNYPLSPDIIFIANGTNSFCSGVDEKEARLNEMEELQLLVINTAKNRFPNAKIIGMLPIWRSDEAGVKFSLKETSERIREVYERFPEISIIDCHEFIPYDAKYFSNAELALHPNTDGQNLYGKHLLEALVNVLGEPEQRDDALLAKQALCND